MLGLPAKEESAAAGVRGGHERRASAEIGFGAGAQLWRPSSARKRRKQGRAAPIGRTIARGVGRKGPAHAGDERSRGFFGGRDRRSSGPKREYGEGAAISRARPAGGNLPETARKAAGSPARTEAGKERQTCLEKLGL